MPVRGSGGCPVMARVHLGSSAWWTCVLSAHRSPGVGGECGGALVGGGARHARAPSRRKFLLFRIYAVKSKRAKSLRPKRPAAAHTSKAVVYG